MVQELRKAQKRGAQMLRLTDLQNKADFTILTNIYCRFENNQSEFDKKIHLDCVAGGRSKEECGSNAMNHKASWEVSR